MNEHAPSFENPPTRDELVALLKDRSDNHGGNIEEPFVVRMLMSYSDLQETLADLENDHASARIHTALHMAEIYHEAGFVEYAIESLEELSETNPSDELNEKISETLDRMLGDESI